MGISNRLRRTCSHYENLVCDVYDLTSIELREAISSDEIEECVCLLMVSLVDIAEVDMKGLQHRYEISKIKIQKCLDEIYDRKDFDIKKKLKYIHGSKHKKYTD